jgi:hypothetical protein
VEGWAGCCLCSQPKNISQATTGNSTQKLCLLAYSFYLGLNYSGQWTTWTSIAHLNFSIQFVFGINWDKVCVLAHTLLDSSGGLQFHRTRQMIDYPNTHVAFSVVN